MGVRSEVMKLSMCKLRLLLLRIIIVYAVFEQAGIDLDQPLVASCGSGVTASVLSFAAYILHKDVPVYDVRMM